MQVVGVGENPALDALVVVDDDAELCEVLRLDLEASGFEVVEAADGLEALARMAERRPDVVLLDLMMPRMSGEALLDRWIGCAKSASTRRR